MPSCKKIRKFQDKDGDVFVLECIEGKDHEGKHQGQIKDVETGFFMNVFFD